MMSIDLSGKVFFMALDHEDIYKHLDFIQLTITRMGANSFLIKGWTVTLVAALLAFTADKDKVITGAWICLIPSLLFWGLDAYYLRQERLFRKLYDVVRLREKTDFSLHAHDVEEAKCVQGWFRTMFTVTLMPFYGLLIAVVIFIAAYNPTVKKTAPSQPTSTFTNQPGK